MQRLFLGDGDPFNFTLGAGKVIKGYLDHVHLAEIYPILTN